MFGSAMLDVLIGLVLLYFLLSITCSAIMEAIAGLQRWRADCFRRAICNLLTGRHDDGADAVRAFKAHPLIDSLSRDQGFLAKERTLGWPSYLSAHIFATALMDLIAPQNIASGQRRTFWALRESIINPQPPVASTTTPSALPSVPPESIDLSNTPTLQGVLQAFVETATARLADGTQNVDTRRLALLRSQIETWYDENMDRATGWYKRRIQVANLFIAVALTTLLNVDTISIARYLITEPGARNGLVALANKTVASQAASPQAPTTAQSQTPGDATRNQALPSATSTATATLDSAIEHWGQVQQTGMPIGWERLERDHQRSCIDWVWFVLGKVGGLLITGFAVSLGAPFWFDILSKLANLRNTGAKPDKSSVSTSSGPPSGESDGGALTSPPVTRVNPPGAASGSLSPTAKADIATDETPSTAILPANYWSLPSRQNDISTFAPHATTYEAANAALMARASLLAYQGESTIRQTLTAAWKLPNANVFNKAGQQGFVAVHKDFLIVSFRGTVPSILNTVLADARICLVDYPTPEASIGKVHCGFLDALNQLLANIDAFVELNPDKPVFVTGHSLGAAMATLYVSHRIQKHQPVAGLYTFGSPRVGDCAFVQYVEQSLGTKSLRFVNDQDLVTRVAPRELGYDHLNAIMFLNQNGTLDQDSVGWIRFLNTVVNAFNNFKAEAQTSIYDHHMELYVRKLDNLAST